MLCDSKKAQGARPRQFIDLKMYESKLVSSDTSIDVNGRFEHSVNKYSGNNRKFVVSAYKFEVKSRIGNRSFTAEILPSTISNSGLSSTAVIVLSVTI